MSARSYCGQGLLENIRTRITLKKPSKERARQESAKWGNNGATNEDSKTAESAASTSSAAENTPQKEESEEEEDWDEASYTFVCR